MNNKLAFLILGMILFSFAFVEADVNKINFGKNQSNPSQMIPFLLNSEGKQLIDLNLVNITTGSISLNATLIFDWGDIPNFLKIDGSTPLTGLWNYGAFGINGSGNISTTGNVSASFFIGDGSLLTGIAGDNSSWNETLANTLYADISVTPGNLSWNETLANTLYADISVVTNNDSWNESLANTLYADISVTPGNLSWNQTLANTLFLKIDGSTPLTGLWNYGAFGINGSGNISTTGNVSANHFMIDGVGNYRLDSTATGRVSLTNTDSGTTRFRLFNDGIGGTNLIDIYGVGNDDDEVNYARMTIGHDGGPDEMIILSSQGGTGTLRPINMYTEGNDGQLLLKADGDNSMIGNLSVAGGFNATGTATVGALVIPEASGGSFIIKDATVLNGGLAIQNTASGEQLRVGMFTADGNGGDSVLLDLYAQGTPTDITNLERLAIGFSSAAQEYHFKSDASGTGTVFPMEFFTEGNSNQFLMKIDGNNDMSGDLFIAGLVDAVRHQQSSSTGIDMALGSMNFEVRTENFFELVKSGKSTQAVITMNQDEADHDFSIHGTSSEVFLYNAGAGHFEFNAPIATRLHTGGGLKFETSTTENIFGLDGLGDYQIRGKVGDDMLFENSDEYDFDAIVIVDRLAVGSNTNVVNASLNMSSGDINADVVYANEFSGKSPINFCDGNSCMVIFPRLKESLWVEKDNNWNVVEITYNQTTYTHAEFTSEFCGKSSPKEELCNNFNDKVQNRKDDIAADNANEQSINTCLSSNYSWDRGNKECYEMITYPKTQAETIVVTQIFGTYQVNSTCKKLTTNKEVYVEPCTIPVINESHIIDIYDWKDGCDWNAQDDFFCTVRELR